MTNKPMLLSIIVPVYNEAATVQSFIKQLLAQTSALGGVEILVVDGGSGDTTVAVVESCGIDCLVGPRGRAQQMNYAATHAKGEHLLFLHCDTTLPAEFASIWHQVRSAGAAWGFFKLQLTGAQMAFRVIETAISWRSRLSGIATGDQAIFVHKDLWRQVQGYRPLALMEDVELSHRLRRIVKPHVSRAAITTSSRRWEQRGLVRTIVLMWFMRACFFFGVSDKTLARWYS